MSPIGSTQQQTVTPLGASARALAAVQAAKNRRKWGLFAMTRFLTNRGVPPAMFFHALRIEQGRGA